MRNASRRESCRAGTACSPGELLAATTAGMVLTPAACSDRSDRDQVSAPPIYLPLRQRRRADVLLVVLRAADRRCVPLTMISIHFSEISSTTSL